MNAYVQASRVLVDDWEERATLLIEEGLHFAAAEVRKCARALRWAMREVPQ